MAGQGLSLGLYPRCRDSLICLGPLEKEGTVTPNRNKGLQGISSQLLSPATLPLEALSALSSLLLEGGGSENRILGRRNGIIG